MERFPTQKIHFDKEKTALSEFEVKSDGRVFLRGIEIKRCQGFSVTADAMEDPEVTLRVLVESVDLDSYQSPFTRKEESSGPIPAER